MLEQHLGAAGEGPASAEQPKAVPEIHKNKETFLGWTNNSVKMQMPPGSSQK